MSEAFSHLLTSYWYNDLRLDEQKSILSVTELVESHHSTSSQSLHADED